MCAKRNLGTSIQSKLAVPKVSSLFSSAMFLASFDSLEGKSKVVHVRKNVAEFWLAYINLLFRHGSGNSANPGVEEFLESRFIYAALVKIKRLNSTKFMEYMCNL